MQTLSQPNATTRFLETYDVEAYVGALPGVDIKAVRTGPGTGPNLTRTTMFDQVTLSSSVIQFPMLGSGLIGENTVLIILIKTAPPGSRWSGIDLEPDRVMLYGQGTPHTGITPAGFSYSFVAVDVRAIEETADQLEFNVNLPDKGRARMLDLTPKVRSLTRTLEQASRPLDSAEFPETGRLDALHAAVAALSAETAIHEAGAGAKIDSRHIAHVCIEYAEAIERVPTIPEMCLAAHVSERRLRHAFNDVFGVPPVRYFNLRSLTEARHELRGAEYPERTVSGIASDLGFHNFGRFARQYRATFGELPSETLRTNR